MTDRRTHAHPAPFRPVRGKTAADAVNPHLPLPIVESWSWQSAAACRGMDSEVFFHPSAADGITEGRTARRRRTERAKAICQSCPVIQECLDYALAAREPYGIWGGRSEDERAQMLGLHSLLYPMPAGSAKPRRTRGQRPVESNSDVAS